MINGKIIRQKALIRLADLFGVKVESLRENSQFGIDLKPSFVSDFKLNEFDHIIKDAFDVADRATTKRIESGELLIQSVQDYCNYMIECYQINPKAVSKLLKL